MIDLPPLLPLPPAPAIEQQVDLECLGFGLDLSARAAEGGPAADFGPLGARITRFYLGHLEAFDPAVDWRSKAEPLPRVILYGDFMSLMNACVPAMDGAEGRADAR